MILAIESSCDESALAVFDPDIGIIFESIDSQIDLHALYGGVVPDLASKEHLARLPLLLENKNLNDLINKISSIAVTYGPGLVSSLMIGGMLAKSISLYLEKPLYGVNHLRGHAWSPFIPIHKNDPSSFSKNLIKKLPHLGLIVSGGNTILFEISKNMKFKILCETVDDAAGEALDKGGKLLGLKYPAGPQIEKLSINANGKFMEFPKVSIKSSDMRFSFSGLKTSLKYKMEKIEKSFISSNINSICASYQSAVFDQLIKKTEIILNTNLYRSFGLSGGVANNNFLKSRLKELCDSFNVPFYSSNPINSGDNAGMIAFASYVDAGHNKLDNECQALGVNPSLTLLE